MKKIICCLTSVIAAFMLIVFLTTNVQAGRCKLPEFDSSNFGSQEDNPYLSMDNIGHTYVYEAETDDGLVRDYQYFYTPSPPIYIRGVAITVVYDVEYLFVEELGSTGEWVLLEQTWDWHAWDRFGNFWYFGEDTEAYEWNEDWTCYTTSTEGAWKAGQPTPDGVIAQPGIILLADPHQGDCVQQEYAPDVALDRGKVLRLNARVSTDYGDYENCEKTKEWTKLDPGNVEHKYYAPDLGLVYIKELKEKTVIFELVEYYSGPPVPSTPIHPSSPCSP